MATIFDVANYFRQRVDSEAGDNITALKLQKLCYYAQAWHLAFTGEPLFEGEFEAWEHGPVNRALWRQYNDHKWRPIPPEGLDDFCPEEVFTTDELHTLNEVWEAYGYYSARYLEDLTHQEDPWREARGDLPPDAPSTAPIRQEHMMYFYRRFAEEAHANQAD